MKQSSFIKVFYLALAAMILLVQCGHAERIISPPYSPPSTGGHFAQEPVVPEDPADNVPVHLFPQFEIDQAQGIELLSHLQQVMITPPPNRDEFLTQLMEIRNRSDNPIEIGEFQENVRHDVVHDDVYWGEFINSLGHTFFDLNNIFPPQLESSIRALPR